MAQGFEKYNQTYVTSKCALKQVTTLLVYTDHIEETPWQYDITVSFPSLGCLSIITCHFYNVSYKIQKN